jgi:5-hydroxyisourate hydrolase-like protein (transthyretin family)
MAVLGVVAMTAAGCGKPGPQVQYVEGVVVLDGEPVADAAVVFVPKAADGLVATGRSNAEGRFTLTSVRGGKPNGGALVGDYAVTFSKADYDLKGTGKTRDEDMDGVPLIHFIPQQYGDAEKSGLKATVKKGQNVGSDFRFELVSGSKK